MWYTMTNTKYNVTKMLARIQAALVQCKEISFCKTVICLLRSVEVIVASITITTALSKYHTIINIITQHSYSN